MWPNCVHAQLQQIKLWPLDQLGNCLISLAIANHKDCHVNHENRSSDAKVVKGQSEDSLSLQLITQTPPNCADYRTYDGVCPIGAQPKIRECGGTEVEGARTLCASLNKVLQYNCRGLVEVNIILTN